MKTIGVQAKGGGEQVCFCVRHVTRSASVNTRKMGRQKVLQVHDAMQNRLTLPTPTLFPFSPGCVNGFGLHCAFLMLFFVQVSLRRNELE